MKARALHLVLPLVLAWPGAAGAQAVFMQKSADAWTRQLADPSPAQRRNAAFALGKLGSQGVAGLARLRTALEGEANASVREAMVAALGEMARESLQAQADPKLEALLGQLLRADADPLVRRSAAVALGSLNSRSPQAVDSLAAALGDERPEVRQNAAWALGQLGDAGIPHLARGLRDDDPLVQRDAAKALLQMTDGDKVHDLIGDLLPLCRSGQVEAKRAAVNVLVRVVDAKDKQAVAPLLAAMADADLEIRRNAALALSNIGGREAAPAREVLVEALHDDNPEVRRQAALGLRGLGLTKNASQALVQVLGRDSDLKAREFAALALGAQREADEPAAMALVARVADPQEAREVRMASATALATIGANAATERTLPALVKVMQDGDQDNQVRERVNWAFRPHYERLARTTGLFEAWTKVIAEPARGDNRTLRYDSAYMLAVVWKSKAPDGALEVLAEYLRDETLVLFEKTAANVGGTAAETKSGQATVRDQGSGDARVMAVDALRQIGAARYGARPEIMTQLRALASEPRTYAPLRKAAQELLTLKR